VAERVKQGGHNIPESVIRRRFDAGQRNFQGPYKSAVDAWALFDNVDESSLLLEWEENRRP
jgi:predicted ABC-type ATPase